jgi:hypothetical protein
VNPIQTFEQIKAEYAAELDKAAVNGKEAKARRLRSELVDALTKGISTDRIEAICAAERDKRVVVLPCKVEALKEKYEAIRLPDGDDYETYTTGYSRGHKNGQAELIEYLLQIDTGIRFEVAEAAIKKEVTND